MLYFNWRLRKVITASFFEKYFNTPSILLATVEKNVDNLIHPLRNRP